MSGRVFSWDSVLPTASSRAVVPWGDRQIAFPLFVQHGVEAADGVFFQAVHGTGFVQNQHQVHGSGLFSLFLLFGRYFDFRGFSGINLGTFRNASLDWERFRRRSSKRCHETGDGQKNSTHDGYFFHN